MTAISLWEPGSCVVIRYRRQWLPGRLVPAEECQEQLDEGIFVVDCMERKQYGVNRFKWPRSRGLLVVDVILPPHHLK